ncbi:hypothetical protein AVEN_9883-1 [Araneus ventricosus]|uniref:CCHC-type domain-containing protein n=1 Tax=Araneus ventricosus TaxID=182803 RepID=A0A4Y2LIL7_ARAVE|nr:hypothetical protein AVEN_9883-1 [Araneus ventricosus]
MGSLKPTDTDTISEYARFLILTVPNGELGNMSPFAVEKALKGIGGSPKSVKKLKSGDLLIETTSAIQTKSFLIAKSILNKPLSVTIHRTLNSCRGVISEPQLLKDTESEILTGLSSQGVIAVRRIHIRRGRDLIPTKHIILTFNSTKLPTNIKAGYLNCKVRVYIPNPIRCFNCQRFGHSKTACRGKQTCSKCASVDHNTPDCNSPDLLCVNCKQPHSSDSRDCPQWKLEKKIQELRARNNLSYAEAKKLLPEQNSVSYSKVVQPATCSCGKKIQPTINQPAACQSAQTDEQITQVFCMPLAKLKSSKSNKSKSETTTVSTVLNTQIPKSSTNVQKKSQNTKSSKSDQWQKVKETKAAKRARLLAEKRNQISSSPSRSLTKEDFLKKSGKHQEKDSDSDLVLSVHPSDEDMSTSDVDEEEPSQTNS